MIRDYEPVLIHAAGCPDAPEGPASVPAVSVAKAYPHGKPHRCLSGAYARGNGGVIVETVVTEPHVYVASTIQPADATRPLCRTCRGTHGDGRQDAGPQEPPTGLIVVRRGAS